MEAGGSGVMEPINVNPFSAGLRVMVVDTDPRELENVRSMLQAYNYIVTAVDDPKDALAIVIERAAELDMILMELHMPPFEEGLEILKHIKANFDIPVVVMSRDYTFEAAETCLQNLASFYLRKPLSMKTIRDLWKFIFMEKEAKKKATGAKRKMHVSQEASPSMGKASGSSSSSLEGVKSTKKGKSNDTTVKPAENKVDWNEELHLQFLQAIDTIGLRNAVPSNILEAMKNPTLTRQQVASHLQKYRKYVRKQGQLMNAMVHLTLHANPGSVHQQPPFGHNHNQEPQLDTGGVQQNFNQLGGSFYPTSTLKFENQYVRDSLSYLNNQG